MSQSPTDLELALDAAASSSAENSAATPANDSSSTQGLPALRQQAAIKLNSNSCAPAVYYKPFALN